MNLYLLTAGQGYYPESGTRDWIACFKSSEEALAQVTEVKAEPRLFLSGPRKGQVNTNLPPYPSHYVINNYKYDWYEIIDLKNWIFPYEAVKV